MLSRSPGAINIDNVAEFISASERNIDLAWVVHFLFDFAYLVLDFKQAVRANRSTHLDLLWREFMGIGHNATSNKTQYVQMAIMRVFWAEAMHPELAHLYHNLRALPMSERVFVGWDTVIEWLNGDITEGVSQLVSEERIAKFVEFYSLMSSNYTELLDVMKVNRKQSAKMRNMDSNVMRMKQWLIDKVGGDWETATRVNSNSSIGIGRVRSPWKEMQASMNRDGAHSVPEFVARHVRGLTSSFFSFKP